MENKSYDQSADVFSFGVNLWELATRRVPYEGMDAVQVALAVTARGERPRLDEETLDPGCPPALVSLIERCWVARPEDRPNFGQIIRDLKASRVV